MIISANRPRGHTCGAILVQSQFSTAQQTGRALISPKPVYQNLAPQHRFAQLKHTPLRTVPCRSFCTRTPRRRLARCRVDVNALNVDLMSISAHKLYGPKGVGALYVRRRPRVRLEPQMNGGGQERGLRSGTVPTVLAVGLGAAAELAGRVRLPAPLHTVFVASFCIVLAPLVADCRYSQHRMSSGTDGAGQWPTAHAQSSGVEMSWRTTCNCTSCDAGPHCNRKSENKSGNCTLAPQLASNRG